MTNTAKLGKLLGQTVSLTIWFLNHPSYHKGKLQRNNNGSFRVGRENFQAANVISIDVDRSIIEIVE